MAHINYNFLTESFLFKSGIEDGFSKYTDDEIRKELDKYRNHILVNIEKIRTEVNLDKRRINVTIESFNSRPDRRLLKQLALYVDCVLIADPLFDLTKHASEASEVMTEYMGMQRHDKIDRVVLVEALKYMKDNTSLIVCDFIKFVPTALIHEAPKDIPIRYDEHGFRDSLPSNLMPYLKDKMDVRNVKSYDGHLIVALEEPLRKGTMLYLYYPEMEHRGGEIVAFQRMEREGDIGSDGRFKARLYIPDTISDFEFSTWLEQSRNTAAKHIFDETVKEYAFASGFDSMYLTQYDIKAHILSTLWDNSVRADIANMAMSMRVPIIENADLDTVLDIRNKYGESFKNFRTELGNKLIKLRTIDDQDKLLSQLAEFAFQINETSINAIDQELRTIKRSIGVDASIVTGSILISCIANNNGSVAGMAMSAVGILSGMFVIAKEVSGDVKNLMNIKDKPEYFLWKIEKEKWKMQ